MNKTYTVKTTSQAEEQIQEIISYIAHELKSPDTALHFLDVLEEAFTSLAHFPQRVALIDEEPWHTKGIHRLPVKNFLVYFWIDENNLKVQIIAVIYEKRDQLHLLAQINIEINPRNRIKEFFQKLHSKSKDLLFTIISIMPEKLIPRCFMNWLEKYLDKRINTLKHESIKMTWRNTYLKSAIDNIHSRQQDTKSTLRRLISSVGASYNLTFLFYKLD